MRAYTSCSRNIFQAWCQSMRERLGIGSLSAPFSPIQDTIKTCFLHEAFT